ncbi:hypothetical protein PV379_03960 [Streptomyces caniscabiei]|uniref:hypothetical protein n=1 Tax=Streptomyces caniscabiei TaxID=2746961 RepID=UPI0029AB8C6D|nr:hypothetical protein [Streptomyces caniscabiei]MDX2776494.1 hypothetical protein [Streptomyces caniscabiei]
MHTVGGNSKQIEGILMAHGATHPNEPILRRIIRDKKKLAVGIGLVLLLVIIVMLLAFGIKGQTGTINHQAYKDTSGGAGLEASIKYGCPKQPCDYNFNVYVYRDDGQQVNVVRPDKDGKVHLAMAEGNYVMLIGKLFGDSKTFPQEPLTLKNGKTLELKLEYR